MPQIPHAEEGLVCPLHQKDMSTVCHKCPWWMQVRGKNPQGEDMIDEWRCAVALLPLLLIENAQVARGTVQAMEMLRNGVVESVVHAVKVAEHETTRRLLDESQHQYPRQSSIR